MASRQKLQDANLQASVWVWKGAVRLPGNLNLSTWSFTLVHCSSFSFSLSTSHHSLFSSGRQNRHTETVTIVEANNGGGKKKSWDQTLS